MNNLKNFIKGFGYALNGIKIACIEERHFRIHIIATLTTIALGCYLQVNRTDWLWLGLAITLVLCTELINTAIESTIDLITEKQHPLAKKAKDMAAGAVLITALFAFIVGVLIFIPALFKS